MKDVKKEDIDEENSELNTEEKTMVDLIKIQILVAQGDLNLLGKINGGR